MSKVIKQEIEFPSKSNPSRKPYVLKVYSDGTMSCNCRGWTNKKVGKPRQCTHTKQVAERGDVPPIKPDADSPPDVEGINLPVMRPHDGTLEHMENPDTIVQLKRDGTYAFIIKEADKVMMPGRSFKSDYTKNHPEFVRDAMKIPRDIILCGELVFIDENGNDYFLTALAKEETWLDTFWTWEKTQRPKRVLTPKYIVFDIQKSGSVDLTDWTWTQRNDFLQELFHDVEFENFELIKNYVTLEEKRHAWEISIEGIVSKEIDSTISDGQTYLWRKVKKLKAEDFWCIGLTKGTGARAVTFGAMMIANKLEDGSYRYVTKTSGFTNEQLKHFLKTLVRNDDLPVIGKLPAKIMYLTDPVLVEIKYQRKTETGSLIMPRFVKERTDIEGEKK